MSLHHQLLILTNPILRLVRKLGCKIGLINPNRLRVLIYHDIPPSEEDSFDTQIRWLKQSWNIVTPLQFENMISGELPIIGDNLLITFDDGLISNRIVAEKILNPMGIQAVFFIISDFTEIKDPFKARQFASDHIMPGSSIKDIPDHWRSLQWSDLTALINQGHTIGCHTKTHKKLSDCTSKTELKEEIVSSANKISHQLDTEIKHFAYTFGDVDSFSEVALSVARSQFSFVHSGLRGNNLNNVSPLAIRRDAVTYQLPNNEYRLFNNKLLEVFLSGFVDFRYTASREILDAWCQQ